VKKEARPRLRDLLFTSRDPPNISGMAEDTHLKFASGLKVRDTRLK